LSFKQELIREITRETERDKQRRVGPSSLGDECPQCLGRAMLGEAEKQDFSLYPWLGTAVHSYLEREVFPDAEHELKLYCGDVEGYGEIKGTTDIYFKEDGGTVGDWKIVGLKKIKEYRVKGPPLKYRYQGMIYAAGCVLSGRPVESIKIIFIPRDSGNVQDIFVWEEEYQPAMVEAVFTRAAKVYEIAQAKGWEILPSSDDCYNCKMGAY
jgi:hypothetical protein